MEENPIISTYELNKHLDDPGWLVVDCRYTLNKPDEKEAQYLDAHIPGAIYAHLDRDLSGEIIPGITGRHPLPSPAQAARVLGDLGIDQNKHVVAYDDQGGALAAGRLWLICAGWGTITPQSWTAVGRNGLRKAVRRAAAGNPGLPALWRLTFAVTFSPGWKKSNASGIAQITG